MADSSTGMEGWEMQTDLDGDALPDFMLGGGTLDFDQIP